VKYKHCRPESRTEDKKVSDRKTQHATIVITRKFDAPVSRVFKAWSDVDAKSRWFVGPPGEWSPLNRTMDFRIGGKDHLSGRLPNGVSTVFDSVYHEIVPNERIVYSFDMHLGTRHITVSLSTVEFKKAGSGTQMTFTEQIVNLDDWEDEGGREREHGTNGQFDRLTEALKEDW
jgi:uncharacterized protein YndB with AHSA1/START domain